MWILGEPRKWVAWSFAKSELSLSKSLRLLFNSIRRQSVWMVRVGLDVLYFVYEAGFR